MPKRPTATQSHATKTNDNHSWWGPIVELVTHVIVGSALFGVIFTPVIGLDLAIHWLEDHCKVSWYCMKLLQWTKYAVGTIDSALYIFFMTMMGLHFVKTMLSKFRQQ